MKSLRKKEIIDLIFKIIVSLFAFLGLAILIIMFSFILKEAFPAYEKYGIKKLYFSANFSQGNYGMLGALSLTLISSIFAIIIALPLATRCAFFLHFRIKIGKKLFITIIHVLASIPSILFGIFAFYSLKKFSGLIFNLSSGQTLINGIIMLTFMIIPTLITMITNQLKLLPKNFVNSSLALGNSKTHAIYTIVKKEIRPGIIVATITALGRAIGETMALSLLLTSIPGKNVFAHGFFEIFSKNIMTLGVVIAKTFFDDVGSSKSHLFAAGILLFIIVMILVLLISKISSKHIFRNKRPSQKIVTLIKNKNPNNIFIHWMYIFYLLLIYPLSLLKYLIEMMWSKLIICKNNLLYFLKYPFYYLFYFKDEKVTNAQHFIKIVKSKRHKLVDIIKILLEIFSMIIISSFTFWIIFDILYNGIPTWTLNDWKYSYKVNSSSHSIPGSIANPLVFTVILIAIVIFISFPISLFIAIYLSEYAKEKKYAKVIRFFLDSLGGTPSVLFGIFGSIFFIQTLNLRIEKIPYSLIAGALTMVLVVIPAFTRSIEQTILRVPKSYCEASVALGASKIRTIFKIIIPQSISGITTGIILTSGRVIAETAPVYLTLGGILSAGEINFLSPGHTLTTEILGTFWTSPNFELQRQIGYKLGSAAIILSIFISLIAESVGPIIKKRPIKKVINLVKLRRKEHHG